MSFMTSKARTDPTIVGNYEIIRKLGKGAYGTVKLGVHIKTGEKVPEFVAMTSRTETKKFTLVLLRWQSQSSSCRQVKRSDREHQQKNFLHGV